MIKEYFTEKTYEYIRKNTGFDISNMNHKQVREIIPHCKDEYRAILVRIAGILELIKEE